MPPIIELTAPPLPHYIVSGLSALPVGGKHPSRKNIGAFDLLVAVRGCLYVGEEEREYEITEGHALILRPDSYHYAYEGCREESLHHWLHFQILGDWRVLDEEEYGVSRGRSHESDPQDYLSLPPFATTAYTLALPQFTRLAQPQKMAEIISELTEMNRHIHLPSVRLKQQALFQEVILILSASLETDRPTPQSLCAERAASYLREHFREPFSAKKLGEAINFHPVYIARCMQKMFGCSPSVYLLRLRIDQSKLLLLQTDLPVERVAEEVGFNQAAYFTASFSRFEGMSPRKYRQRFAYTKS